MSKPSKAQKALLFSLKNLESELSKPDLSAGRKSSLLREYSRCALSLSKLEQLQARLRLQGRKPLQPVTARRPEPKSALEEMADAIDFDVAECNRILGGDVEPGQPDPLPEPTEPATVDSESGEPIADEGETEGDDPEEDPEPAPVETEIQSEERNEPVRNPDPEPASDWLERSLWEQARQERAEALRRQVLPLPGEVPEPSDIPTGEGRFSLSDMPAKQQTEFYDAWRDDTLGKPAEPEF